MINWLSNLLRPIKTPTPWPRMILCAFASVCPLLLGLANNQVGISIYGSLTGYLLALNDHLGNKRHRLLVASLTFLLLACGFCGGFALQGHSILFTLILLIFVYWLGIFGGGGAELERAILFSMLAMTISFFTKNVDPTIIAPILFYCTIGFLGLFIGTLTLKLKPELSKSLRSSLRESIHITKEKSIYAVSYSIATLLSIFIADYFQLERGYWITITVLLVMRPDRRQSIHTTLQRLFGTALAVLFCQLFLPFGLHLLILIAMAGLSAFIVPLGLKKNYLYASFFVTIYILFLLELASVKHGDTTNAFFRMRATAIGCTLSLAGTFISETLSMSPLRRMYARKKTLIL